MDSIIQFLKEDILPEEKVKVDKVRRKATSYWLSEDHRLHKRSFSGPYLLCVHPDQTELLLEEMHEGIYGSHTGGKSLAHRAITQGYWWQNMQREAEYEDLLEGMTMVQRMGGKSIKLFSDSRLVVGQVRGEFEAKDERM